ncbi:MAG: hypothetical protein ACFE89_02470 [Candidatus Hodarchaeota archaeon]
MTWELEPTAKLKLVKSILPKENETLLLVARSKAVTGVRAGSEPITVRGQDGYFILTSYRVTYLAEIEGLPPEEQPAGQLIKGKTLVRVFMNLPLVFLPQLRERPDSYTQWKKHMNLVIEKPDGVQEIVYIKATGDLLDFQRTSHDFFKQCFTGPINFEALKETGVKHTETTESYIYDLIGKRISQQMMAVPESLLDSYRKKARTTFNAFIRFLGKKGQGGFYDPVARTLVIRGTHVHITLDWIATSNNPSLTRTIQQYIEEWRSEVEVKSEKLGDRYEITGF